MIFSALGWFGALLYLFNHAYLALREGHESPLYYWLNLVAAAALVASSAALWSWQPVITNAFWVGVSMFALLRRSRPDTGVAARVREVYVVAPIAIALLAGLAVAIATFYTGMSILGWAGTALFSAAYLMFATNLIVRRRFLLYNAIAALALSPILFLDGNWPVLFLELVWAVTSLVGWYGADRPDCG